MSSSRLRLRRASFSLNLPKHDVYKTTATSNGIHEISPGSNLTPDVQAPSSKPLTLVGANFVRIGNYVVSGAVNDGAGSQPSSNHDAVNVVTEERLTCKVKLLCSLSIYSQLHFCGFHFTILR